MLLLGQDLELVWAVWFAKVFDIPLSQAYAVKVLQSDNDLAIIIMLDIIECNGLSSKTSIQKEYKALLKRLMEIDNDDGKTGQLPWSSHWLLAYEAERCERFNAISEIFDIMKKDPFFMKLLKQDMSYFIIHSSMNSLCSR